LQVEGIKKNLAKEPAEEYDGASAPILGGESLLPRRRRKKREASLLLRNSALRDFLKRRQNACKIGKRPLYTKKTQTDVGRKERNASPHQKTYSLD